MSHGLFMMLGMSVQVELHRLIDDVLGEDSKRALAAYRRLADDHLPWLERRAVLLARRRGASWAAIGRLLGRSRQSVQQRFDRVFTVDELIVTEPLRQPADDERRRSAQLIADVHRQRRAGEPDVVAW
jgi:hypothetical protein